MSRKKGSKNKPKQPTAQLQPEVAKSNEINN
jgi:hypothetical protein